MLQLLKNTTGIHSFLQFSQQQNPTRNNCIVIVYKVARLVILSRKMFLLVWWGGVWVRGNLAVRGARREIGLKRAAKGRMTSARPGLCSPINNAAAAAAAKLGQT